MVKAQVGDLIRVIDKDVEVEAYKVGGIYEVAGYYPEHNQIIVYGIDGMSGYLEEHEYEIHRKAGEEDAPKGLYIDYLKKQSESQDAVHHPNHYTQGRFETIEIIEEITQGYLDGYVAYCVGNALKYLARAPFKHGEPTEDLAKAAKYLAFANAYLTQETTE